MKKGNILMIVGGGLLVGYLPALYLAYNQAVSGVLDFLRCIPIFTFGNSMAMIRYGDVVGGAFTVMLIGGFTTLIIGAGMSIFKSKARARA